MKKTPLRRKKPLRRVSRKQKGRLELYYWLREPFMQNNPICQICGVAPSTDCHHQKGRRGNLLFDQRYWMALCNHCHIQKVHGNVKWALENGYLLSNK